jgi:hypothetical protein
LVNQPTLRVRSMSSNSPSRPWPSSCTSTCSSRSSGTGTRQRGQQQVVDLGVVGRRRLLQQLAGLLGIQAMARLGVAMQVAALG